MHAFHRLMLVFACAPLAAQGTVDLDAAKRELDVMFDRPAGTTISQEAKDRLGDFLGRHAGRDLAQLGYAQGIYEYLTGDYAEAAVSLDRFFERFDTIENEEHAMIAGRIYVNAVMRPGPDADVAVIARRAERMARLYSDVQLLQRAVPTMLGRLGDDDARTVRLAIARGVLDSKAGAEAKEGLLATLFGDAAAPATVAAARVRPAAADPNDARARATRVREALTGKPVPELDVRAVVQGPDDFSLASLRGKVVVLDFTATWCGPCRTVVPKLVELQKKRADSLQVVGVTRLYGYGVDFSGEGVTLPHGGKSVKNLDEEAEIAVNEAFVEAFGIGYPVVIAREKKAHEQFGVTGIPTVFVIGKDGKVAGHVVGASDRSHETLLDLVDRALR